MVHDPPPLGLHKETRCDPITSSFTSCDLTFPFPIGSLYLGKHPCFIKRSHWFLVKVLEFGDGVGLREKSVESHLEYVSCSESEYNDINCVFG